MPNYPPLKGRRPGKKHDTEDLDTVIEILEELADYMFRQTDDGFGEDKDRLANEVRMRLKALRKLRWAVSRETSQIDDKLVEIPKEELPWHSDADDDE